MKRFSEQFKKQADAVTMRAAERRALRDRLVSYMEYHPLPAAPRAELRTSAAPLAVEPYWTLSLRSLYVRGTLGTLALFLVVGVPLVAERALPGDVLYPVKVRFNEELRGTLAFSPYEKVEWETERLGRRIAEARLLAGEGKLTEEYEAEVAEAVRLHSDAALREIAVLRETDAEEAAIASITFSSALEVQSVVLRSNTERASTSVDAIAGAVEAERSAVAAQQEDASVLPSIDRLIARVEQETTRAFELLESVRGVAAPEEIAAIERRLADIERKIAVAQAAAGGEAVDVATTRVLLREALQATQKLISFMTDIDIRESVDVNDLVPVELTEEERLARLTETLTAVRDMIAVVEARLPDIEDEDLAAKVEAGLADVEAGTEDLEEFLTDEDLTEAEALAEEVRALALDLVTLAAAEVTAGDETERGTLTATTTETLPAASSTATTTAPSAPAVGEGEGETATTATSTAPGATTSSPVTSSDQATST